MKLPATLQDTQEKLSSVASMVARYLALGLSFEEIAGETSLSLEQVAKVARGNLVKKRVKELSKEIDDRLVEEAAEDPVRLYLKKKSKLAAERLVYEMDNFNKEEEGASASTRLKAAESILGISGYKESSGRTEGGNVIMISTEKVEIGRSIIEKNITTMPDFVDG